MLTISQKRRRAARLKAGVCMVLAALVFTPKLEGLDLGSLPFPLVTTANAAPID